MMYIVGNERLDMGAKGAAGTGPGGNEDTILKPGREGVLSHTDKAGKVFPGATRGVDVLW